MADWSGETPKYLVPRPTLEDREFWEGARRGELRIQHCTTCGKHQHYPRMLCSHCGEDTLEWITASGNGTVYSFTTIRQNGVPPFNERVPFVVATVDLDEDGARMIAAMPATRARGSAGRHAGARRVPAGQRRRRVRRLRAGGVVEQPVALDGRALGRRGIQTRNRLLDATASLLETHGVRDVRVVEIAHAVETSPATFYQYFRDVEDAVLILAAQVGAEMAPLAAALTAPWIDGDSLASARTLVDGFIDFWDRHRAVLRTRNLAAQEGDDRFRDVRNRANAPFLDGFRAPGNRGTRTG